jgi:hypothetical protein
LQATAFWLVIIGLCVFVMAGCAGAAQAQDDRAERQAAAWKAIVDQIAAIDPDQYAKERFWGLLAGNPGDRPPPDKRQALCTYVLTEGTKGRVPVDQIARASRLCAR